MEEAFRQVDGVVNATVGYCGGSTANPTYGDVCSGTTGHTEAIEVEFDPSCVSYEQLLCLFWALHDPTDNLIQYHGGQYKSVVFYCDETQETAAIAVRHALQTSGKFQFPIVTQILPEAMFWPAEDYHQQYLAKRFARACSR